MLFLRTSLPHLLRQFRFSQFLHFYAPLTHPTFPLSLDPKQSWPWNCRTERASCLPAVSNQVASIGVSTFARVRRRTLFTASFAGLRIRGLAPGPASSSCLPCISCCCAWWSCAIAKTKRVLIRTKHHVLPSWLLAANREKCSSQTELLVFLFPRWCAVSRRMKDLELDASSSWCRNVLIVVYSRSSSSKKPETHANSEPAWSGWRWWWCGLAGRLTWSVCLQRGCICERERDRVILH